MSSSDRLFKVSTILFVLVNLSSCSSLKDEETTIKPTTLNTFQADPGAELGSRNNPVPFGKTALVNKWKVQVESVNRDAQKSVLDSNPYSSRPASNERFVLLIVKATFIGENSGEPQMDLRFKIVGSKGNTFSKSCGYSADTFNENGETFKGASVAGSLCFTVDSDQIEGAILSVQGDYSTDDRKFLSLDLK